MFFLIIDCLQGWQLAQAEVGQQAILFSALFFKTSLPRQAFEKAVAEAQVLISPATYFDYIL